MKKLLLLLLLCPVMAMAAKFYPGTITFNDGSTKTGQIAIPAFDSQNLKFRTNEKAKTEKLSINDVKKFTVTVEKDEGTYYALKVANPKMFTTKLKVEDKKSWVRMFVEGKGINLVTISSYTPAVMGAVGSTASSSFVLYFWKPENDYCSYWYAEISSGITINVGVFKALVKGVEINFDEECPELAKKMTKEDFKTIGYRHIITLYDQNCGSTKSNGS